MAQEVVLRTNMPNLIHRGKVRDTYDLGVGLLLMVATDRISTFDVVHPTGIPFKGLTLARLSTFWFRKTAHIVPNHFIGMADEPEMQRRLKGNPVFVAMTPQIARQAMVIRKAERVNIECVARGYLAGSAWAEYKSSGTACGIAMPKGLLEGSRLPKPVFTPTTKAETGHDENMVYEQVVEMMGSEMAERLEKTTLAIYDFGHDFALSRGIILADTKVEFGIIDGKLSLIDELMTSDSSRFWDKKSYKPGQSQPSFDKQPVRDWGVAQGWNKQPPAPALPPDVVKQTTERYLKAYELLTGQILKI
jgi:phosphoribosylaminoimidazole-succinocarboxamide synthase